MSYDKYSKKLIASTLQIVDGPLPMESDCPYCYKLQGKVGNIEVDVNEFHDLNPPEIDKFVTPGLIETLARGGRIIKAKGNFAEDGIDIAFETKDGKEIRAYERGREQYLTVDGEKIPYEEGIEMDDYWVGLAFQILKLT